jgi:hypothetical protein
LKFKHDFRVSWVQNIVDIPPIDGKTLHVKVVLRVLGFQSSVNKLRFALVQQIMVADDQLLAFLLVLLLVWIHHITGKSQLDGVLFVHKPIHDKTIADSNGTLSYEVHFYDFFFFIVNHFIVGSWVEASWHEAKGGIV